MGELRTIEGGRSIAARDVHASFAVDSDDLVSQVPNMAGYCIIVWDDEGGITSHASLGRFNPFSPAMVPDIVRMRASHHMMEPVTG